MNYKIIYSDKFEKQVKKLAKKYRSLKNDLKNFERDLSQNPEQGEYLGNNTYKVRLAIKSKGKGKRGGARIITYLVTENLEIFLLTIYDKSKIENVTKKEIKDIINNLKIN